MCRKTKLSDAKGWLQLAQSTSRFRKYLGTIFVSSLAVEINSPGTHL